MITEIKESFRLTGNSSYGCFGKASWFTACARKSSGKAVYATIREKRPVPLTDEERMKSPWMDPTHTFKHTYLKLNEGTELTRAIQKCYFPGGYHIEFLEKDDVWLVIFKAELILSSAYMFLTKEEMTKLMPAINRSIETRARETA